MARPTLWSDARAEQYRRLGYWTDDTYVRYFRYNAQRYPHVIALSAPDHHYTWAEADRWTDAVALSLIDLGTPRDAVLATWLPNCPENYLLRVACEKAGVLWLPLSRSLRQHELRPVLARARAHCLVLGVTGHRDYWSEIQELLPGLPHLKTIITDGHGPPGVPALYELAGRTVTPQDRQLLLDRRFRPDEVAMLQPTSGSTGTPKLCEYLLHGAVARGKAQAELFRLSPEDVIIATVQGFGPSITPLLAGPVAACRVIVVDHMETHQLLRLVEREHATVLCGVPPILADVTRALADGSVDVSSVRIWYSTGMALSPRVAQALEDRTGGVVLSGYGGVDLGVWTAPSPEDPREIRWYTVGRPRGGTEIRLVDDEGTLAETGEVWGRGPSSIGGYYGDPEATRQAWTEDGWFRTGDIGRFDEHGNLVIVGRRADVINRGGQKVYPAEVEHILEEHPQIARAALVPMPDERLGETVCAYLVPVPGAALSLEEVVAFLRARNVASFKIPQRIEVVESLPATSGGKTSRQALLADLLARLEAEKASGPGP